TRGGRVPYMILSRDGSTAPIAVIGRALALEGVEQHLIAASAGGAALAQRVIVGLAGVLVMVAVPVGGIGRELASDSRAAGQHQGKRDCAETVHVGVRCLIGSCRRIGGCKAARLIIPVKKLI